MAHCFGPAQMLPPPPPVIHVLDYLKYNIAANGPPPFSCFGLSQMSAPGKIHTHMALCRFDDEMRLAVLEAATLLQAVAHVGVYVRTSRHALVPGTVFTQDGAGHVSTSPPTTSVADVACHLSRATLATMSLQVIHIAGGMQVVNL
jgi:hypothetical protein